MSEYGPGLTMEQAFAYDRERIEHALKGELFCGETENGFEYAPCSREEAEAYILSAFDNAVFQCQQINQSAVALEKLLEKHGINTKSKEFLQEYLRTVQGTPEN